MPGYVNPYIQSAVPPMNSYAMAPSYMPTVAMSQQSYVPANTPMASNVVGWQVDGEIGAKAFNTPTGAAGPFALWDLNDNVIYMRTYNAAGMPNPLRKLRYVEEEISPVLPAGQSGNAQQIDTSQFAMKSEIESLKQEIQQLTSAIQNSRGNGNGTSSQGNQNGNNNRNNGNQGR